jgi:hypothetical protein
VTAKRERSGHLKGQWELAVGKVSARVNASATSSNSGSLEYAGSRAATAVLSSMQALSTQSREYSRGEYETPYRRREASSSSCSSFRKMSLRPWTDNRIRIEHRITPRILLPTDPCAVVQPAESSRCRSHDGRRVTLAMWRGVDNAFGLRL